MKNTFTTPALASTFKSHFASELNETRHLEFFYDERYHIDSYYALEDDTENKYVYLYNALDYSWYETGLHIRSKEEDFFIYAESKLYMSNDHDFKIGDDLYSKRISLVKNIKTGVEFCAVSQYRRYSGREIEIYPATVFTTLIDKYGIHENNVVLKDNE